MNKSLRLGFPKMFLGKEILHPEITSLLPRISTLVNVKAWIFPSLCNKSCVVFSLWGASTWLIWLCCWCGADRYIFYFISTAQHRSLPYNSAFPVRHSDQTFTLSAYPFPAVYPRSYNPWRFCALGCMYAWLGSVFPCFLWRTWTGEGRVNTVIALRGWQAIHINCG